MIPARQIHVACAGLRKKLGKTSDEHDNACQAKLSQLQMSGVHFSPTIWRDI